VDEEEGSDLEGKDTTWAAVVKERLAKAQEKLIDAVTIKERGDIVDTTLISIAMAVYVYLSMQLFRLYAFMVHMGGSDF